MFALARAAVLNKEPLHLLSLSAEIHLAYFQLRPHQDASLDVTADRLWMATGSLVDAAREPLMQGLLEALPVSLHGGLPALQPDLVG
jgi:hypothetical protein